MWTFFLADQQGIYKDQARYVYVSLCHAMSSSMNKKINSFIVLKCLTSVENTILQSF